MSLKDGSVKPASVGPVAPRITNQVRGIKRAVYDYISKPPGTIECA